MNNDPDFGTFAKPHFNDVPDGFFEQLPHKTLILAKKRKAAQQQRKLVIGLLSAAAGIALVVALGTVFFNQRPITPLMTEVIPPIAITGDSIDDIVIGDSIKITEKQMVIAKPEIPKTQALVNDTSINEEIIDRSEKTEDLDQLLAQLSDEMLLMLIEQYDDTHFGNN